MKSVASTSGLAKPTLTTYCLSNGTIATTRGIFGTTLEINPTKKIKEIEPRAMFFPNIIANTPDILAIMPVFSRLPISTKMHIKKIKVLQSTSCKICFTVSILLW